MITLTGIRNTFFCALAFAIVACVGCASAPMPSDKLAVARSAVERAEQAQAAQFAPVELAAARSKLEAAQAAVREREAVPAGRLADQAEVDAQLAEATARAEQQQRLVTEMEQGLRDLQNEASRANPAAAPQSPQ